jgi:hypothetical protein
VPLSLSLPYRRSRRYLTGIDYVVGALHEVGKKTIGNGAVSQAIIEVTGRLDEAAIRSALQQISNRFPLLHGCFARDWFNLAPYWKVPASSGEIELKVVDLPSGSGDESDRLLAEHVNEPLNSDRQHLRFLLIRIGNEQSRLGLLFDHRLFDAYGAEAFFRLIDATSQGKLDEIAPLIKTTEPAHLDHWKRRFASGKTLNRLLIQLQQKGVCALPMPKAGVRQKIRFVQEPMTVEQTVRINKKAFEEIGMPILLPSAAARAVAAVQSAVPNPPLAGTQYLLFTSANMRAAGEEWASMFFNHFSFVYFSAPIEEKKTLKEMAIILRDQFFQHIKDKIPVAMQDAAALGRIFPRSMVGKIINSMFKGRMCSFYFACLKESGYPGETFMGLPATNLIHTPLAFAPPGLNLCMTFFAGRFNLVLAYLEGAMDDATAREILAKFKASLISDETPFSPR